MLSRLQTRKGGSRREKTGWEAPSLLTWNVLVMHDSLAEPAETVLRAKEDITWCARRPQFISLAGIIL